MSIPAQGAVGAETMTADWADTRPNLGAQTNEPSLREVLFAYYKPWFQPGKAMELSNRYIAALASPRADSAERTAGASILRSASATDKIAELHHQKLRGIRGRWEEGAFLDDGEIGFLLRIAEMVAGNPVEPRYQYREIGEGEGWRDCSRESYLAFARDPHIDTRELSPAPATPPGVPDSLRALSEAATKGEWYTESEKCDGSYGSGEDCGEGYLAYSILTDAEPRYGNPGVIAETSNSTLGVIHEEADEDGFTAWDETARANTAFIVAAVNFVRTLLASHPAGQSAGSGAETVKWGSANTVGELMAQLRTLPADAKIFGTFKGPEDKGDDYRTGVRGVLLSRERVRGRWIRTQDKEAPYEHVIWTKPEPAPDSTRTGQGEAETATEKHLREALTVAASRMEVASMDWGIAAALASDKLTHADDMDQWAKDARAALAARPAVPEAQGAEITADVLTMRLGDGQADYFVRLKCGERWVTPHVFKDRYKAEYEAAYYAWMFGLRAEQPDLMAYDEASHPNEPAPPASSGQGGR